MELLSYKPHCKVIFVFENGIPSHDTIERAFEMV